MILPDHEQHLEMERILLQEEYEAWHAILMVKCPVAIDDPFIPLTERRYGFAIDRQGDELSQVTVDQVNAYLLREDRALEEFRDIDNPRIPKTQIGERWVYLFVTP